MMVDEAEHHARRAVILGGRGFVGRAVSAAFTMANWPSVSLGTRDCDLLDPNSVSLLGSLLGPADTIVYSAARAPARERSDVLANVTMTTHLVEGLNRAGVRRLIVISSDSVYGEIGGLLTELSPVAPTTVHGEMHALREGLCTRDFHGSIAFVRPPGIYGPGDPHDAYGPNRFVRSAWREGVIPLLGEGRAQRDHIAVEDVADLVTRVAHVEFDGVINAATGQSISFAALASVVAESAPRPCAIVRVGEESPPTSRAYDVAKLQREFPGFTCRSLTSGVRDFFTSLNRA